MITAVSLFSGIGGIDLAFMQAGIDVIWANEADKFACTTYRSNFTNKLIEADIRTVNAEDIPKADVLFGGFPCQSFSVMGYKKGFNDSRGNLFFEVARIAEQMQPKVILLENVKNLIYHDNGRTFITIHNTLAELGYFIKYEVQNARTHSNIPQERSRTFIAAFFDPDMMNRFKFPEEIHLTVRLNDIIDRSIRHNDIYYYTDKSKYYRLLNERITDKTGIYRRIASLKSGKVIEEPEQLEKYLNCEQGYLFMTEIIEYCPVDEKYTAEQNAKMEYKILDILDRLADTANYKALQIQISRIVLYWLKKSDEEKYGKLSECVELAQGKLKFLQDGTLSKSKNDNYGFNASDVFFLMKHFSVSVGYMFTGNSDAQ